MASDWKPDSEALARYLAEFAGTPHMQRRREAGRGVDCIQLVLGALEAAGATDRIEPPGYSQLDGIARQRNTMEAPFLACFHTDRIEPVGWTPQDADVCLFRVGRNANHCGIVSAGRLWHVLVTRPTHHAAPAALHRQIESVIRFRKPGLRAAIPTTLK